MAKYRRSESAFQSMLRSGRCDTLGFEAGISVLDYEEVESNSYSKISGLLAKSSQLTVS